MIINHGAQGAGTSVGMAVIGGGRRFTPAKLTAPEVQSLSSPNQSDGHQRRPELLPS